MTWGIDVKQANEDFNEEFLAKCKRFFPGKVIEECRGFARRHPEYRLHKIEDLPGRYVVTVSEPQEGGKISITWAIRKP